MSIVTVFSARVCPERFRRYEDLCRSVAEKAAQKRDSAHYTTHQAVFGTLGLFHFVARDESWKALAERGPADALILRVLGEKEGHRVLEEARECVVEARQTVSRERPELSYPPDGERAPSPAAVVTRLRTRPGGQDAVEELLRKIAEAIPKVGDPAHLTAHQTLVGVMNEYWSVRPVADLAELDGQLSPQDLLTKAFGAAEGGLIFRTGIEALAEIERSIVLYREDLSHPPGS